MPLRVERWSPCQRCRSRVSYSGRGRPARFCAECQIAIVARASQVDLVGNPACVVCDAPLDPPEIRRRERLTCGDACRRFLARLRADLAPCNA